MHDWSREILDAQEPEEEWPFTEWDLWVPGSCNRCGHVIDATDKCPKCGYCGRCE